MNKSNMLSTKLKSIYILQYAAIACFMPFLAFHFQQKGFSYTQIGIALAVYNIAGIITQPIWGVITDRFLNKRISLIIAMLLSSLAIYLFIYAEGFYFILISMVVLLSFQSSVAPLSDAYTYEIAEHHKEIQYGKIRLMGSIGYAVTALCIGQLVKFVGINSSFYLFSMVMFLGALIVISIKFQGKSINEKIDFSDIVNLVKDRRFAILLFVVIINNISFGTNNTYITMLIQKTGGDVSKLGLLWFVMAMSELPVLFLGDKLIKKFGDLNLFTIGIALFILRYFLDSLASSYTMVIVIQITQLVTSPLFLIASLHYLNRVAHVNMKTSAMTMYAASGSIGAFIGNMFGGMLLEHITIFALFRLIAIISAICLIFALILKKVNTNFEAKLQKV